MAHPGVNPLICLNAGEWSPAMDSRIDLANYRKACRKLRNMIPLKQGGVTRRPGTEFIAAGKLSHSGDPSVSRLQKFQFAPGTSFILEFCDQGIRFYSNGAQVVLSTSQVAAWVSGTDYAAGAFVKVGSTIYYLYNGPLLNSTTTPGSDLTHWTNQSVYEVPAPYSGTNFTAPDYWEADVFVLQCKAVNDVVYIVHPSFPVYKLVRYTDSNWVLSEVQFLTPAMLDENATDITIAASATTGTGITLDAGAPNWAPNTFYSPGNAINTPQTIFTAQTVHTSTSNVLTAGSFVVGGIYLIDSIGTTDFTLIGASANTVGIFFVATGAGTGSGTADGGLNTDIAHGYWAPFTMFQSDHVGSYWQLAYNRPASLVQYALTGNGSSSTLFLVGTWEVLTYGTWEADISVQVSYDNGATWQVVATLTADGDANYNIQGSEIQGGLYKLVITNWGSTTSATPPRVVLQADNQFVYGLVQITAVSNPYIATANVITSLYSTAATPYWSEGAWSEVRGYPQALTFFQERMWYGASSFQPQRVWATQTDDLENFGLLDQSQPSYGLAFDLNAPERGAIEWMNAQTELLCGLSGAEWVITSGAQTAGITSSAIIALEHSAHGSNPATPGTIIGNAVFYVQRKGTNFMQMLFSVFTNKYMSQDMQVLSQHLTSARLKQFDYQNQFQDQSLIWAVCGDGSLVSMTYAMEQEVFGWSGHNTGVQTVPATALAGSTVYTIAFQGTTDFTLIGAPNNKVGTTFTASGVGTGTGLCTQAVDFGFLSVQVIYGDSGQDDEVWVSTQRANETASTIERLNPSDWQTANLGQPDVSQAIFADCATVVENPGSNVIAGIPSVLYGRTVCASVFTTGGNQSGLWTWQGLVVGSSGGNAGKVTLPNYAPAAGDVVVVGLPIPWQVQPMRLDVDPRAGETPGLKKAIQRIYPRMLNSIGGNWAPKSGQLFPFPTYRNGLILGQPLSFPPNEPTEDTLDVGGVMEYEDDPVFVIEGTDPLPFTLLGVTVKYDIGGAA